MKNIIITILFFCVGFSAFAQDANSIHLEAFYVSDEVRLRWAIDDYDLWKWGIDHGYTISRYTTEANGVALDYDAQVNSMVNLVENYKAKSAAEIESLYPNNTLAQTGKELVYNDEIADRKVDPQDVSLASAVQAQDKEDAQFIFAQMTADMDFETAQALGLGYIDDTAEAGKEYHYSLFFTDQPTFNLSMIDSNDLEVSPGIWADGGAHCIWRTWGPARATSGVKAIFLRNSGPTANTTASNIDLSGLAVAHFYFAFKTEHMEIGDGFEVQLSVDNAPFETLKAYEVGVNISNNTAYQKYINLGRATGAQDVDIRIQMNSNANSDYIFLDDMAIKGIYEVLGGYKTIDTYSPFLLTDLEITSARGLDHQVELEWDVTGDAGIYSYFDIERAEVGGGVTCEDIPSIIATSPLANGGWNNQYNVGGDGLDGDGELCFTPNDMQGFVRTMIGLNDDPFTNASYNRINNAIYIWKNSTGTIFRIYVFENGRNKGWKINQNTSYEGQTFCIRRTGTTIEYMLDGTTFYTSLTPSTGELFFDNSFVSYPGSSIAVNDITVCPTNSSGGNEPLTWVKVNDLPFIYAESEGVASTSAIYQDNIPDNETTYAYRVCGKTPYGTLSPPSDSIHVKGHPPMMEIDFTIDTTIYDAGPDNLLIEWVEQSTEDEAKIVGYDIYRSRYFDGPFEKVNEVLIENDSYAYNDIDPVASAYYKVVADDVNDYTYTSLVEFVQLPDSIPPAVPVLIDAEFVSDDEIKVTWNHVVDEDLFGYRVAFANGINGRYMQLNSIPVKTDHYTFPLDLNTEVDSIYIKVSAEDFRQNISLPSDPVGVERPDIYGPAAPLLSKVAPTPEGVAISWVYSSSDDITKHTLQRRAANSPTWMDMVSVTATQEADYPSGALEVSYIDSTYATVEDYQYRFIAYDGNYNLTSSKVFTTRPYQKQVQGHITNVEVEVETSVNIIDPDVAEAINSLQEAGVNNSLTRRTPPTLDYGTKVKWTYPLDPSVKEFKIYRSLTGGNMKIYRTLTVGDALGFEDSEAVVTGPMGNTDFSFTDAGLIKNKRYVYEIKAVHNTGAVSHRSSQVSMLVE